MKTLVLILCTGALALLAACTGTGGGAASGNSATSNTGPSGVTVFGTVDTSITGTRSQSGR